MKTERIHIDSRTEQLIAVRDFVSRAAAEFGFSDEEVSKIALAVDEACTNVIKHAYQFKANGRITVEALHGDGAFTVSVIDNGREFDPEDIRTPDMKEYLAQYRRGGLGVYLMRSLMDEVEYHITPGRQNEVRMTKFLRRAS